MAPRTRGESAERSGLETVQSHAERAMEACSELRQADMVRPDVDDPLEPLTKQHRLNGEKPDHD